MLVFGLLVVLWMDVECAECIAAGCLFVEWCKMVYAVMGICWSGDVSLCHGQVNQLCVVGQVRVPQQIIKNFSY